MYQSLRESLGNRKKVAIVGFCASSRDLTPWDDPEFEIWGLNRGYLFMPKADRWFEMHGRNIYGSQQRRPGKHVQWLNDFKGPVYMHQKFEEVDTCVAYPLAEMAEFFGPNIQRIGVFGPKKGNTTSSGQGEWHDTEVIRDTTGEPYLSSSIAYEIALAIYEGFGEIHLYGVDLNTEAEYAWQKPGVEFLLGVAAGRGIKVVLPDNCPLLKGTLYGRGFMSERPEQMSYEQLAKRLKSLQKDHQIGQGDLHRLLGAKESLQFVMDQMTPGIDHEMMDDRMKAIDKNIAQVQGTLLQYEGMIKETAYWLHQTMEGQDPKEAVDQLRAEVEDILEGLNDKELVAEGPITNLEVLQSNGFGDPKNLEITEEVAIGAV